MAEVTRAAVVGTGTMGPGMGAVLARAGIETALYDVSEEALERARAGVQLAEGVLDRLEAPKADGGAVRFETDLAGTLVFSGPGAGGDATASAILGDVIAIARSAR